MVADTIRSSHRVKLCELDLRIQNIVGLKVHYYTCCPKCFWNGSSLLHAWPCTILFQYLLTFFLQKRISEYCFLYLLSFFKRYFSSLFLVFNNLCMMVSGKLCFYTLFYTKYISTFGHFWWLFKVCTFNMLHFRKIITKLPKIQKKKKDLKIKNPKFLHWTLISPALNTVFVLWKLLGNNIMFESTAHCLLIRPFYPKKIIPLYYILRSIWSNNSIKCRFLITRMIVFKNFKKSWARIQILVVAVIEDLLYIRQNFNKCT